MMELNISYKASMDNLNESFTSNASSGITLQYLNDEETRRRIVPLVYLGILTIIGIPGNAIIMYIYLVKFQKKVVHRTFVVALALMDFLVCSLAIPFEISQMTHEYTFYSEWLCKFGKTMIYFFTIASAFILVALSFNRYYRICHPMNRQLDYKQAMKLIAIIIFCALVFALPAVAISGIKFHKLENNLIGKDCSGCEAFSHTIYPMIYSTGILVIFTICMIVLLVMCVLIGHQIVLHEKFRDQFRTSKRNPSFGTTECNANLNANDSEKQKLNNGPKNQQNGVYNEDKKHINGRFKKSKLSRSKLNSPMKVTKTAVVVSMFFIVLFLPYAILKVVDAVKEGNIMPPSVLASIILPTFSRSHLMNNVVNFFVYLRMDLAFRRHCKGIIVAFVSLFTKRH